MNDIGLLGALGELPLSSIMEKDRLFTEFKGAMTEQYVLQQLISDMKKKAILLFGRKLTWRDRFPDTGGNNRLADRSQSGRKPAGKKPESFC